MSGDNPNASTRTTETVTNPVNTHVKDPRRVEARRRLARISQEAKAKKRAQRDATE
jgi:hypothetical protein